MTSKIQPRPKITDDEALRFIQGAPDGGRAAAAPAAPVEPTAPAPATRSAVEPAEKKRKEVISLGIHPDLLADMDKIAGRLSITRAAAFALACSRFIAEEKKEG